MPRSLIQNRKPIRWAKLDKHVLLVAAKGVQGWGLHIGIVEGEDYEKEATLVVDNGSGVTHQLAEIYFPDLARNLMTKWNPKQEHFFPTDWFEAKWQRDRKLITEGKQPGKPVLGRYNILALEPIDKRVLLVAALVDSNAADWVGYVGAVEGDDYEEEAAAVIAGGSEIPYQLAKIYFKDLTRDPDLRWHREQELTDFDVFERRQRRKRMASSH